MAKSSLRFAALVALGTLSFPLAAHAATITVGSTTSGITLTGTGTLVDASITSGTGGGTLLGSSIMGSYTFGAVTFTAGPIGSGATAEQYPVTLQSPLSETFTYSDSAGNALTGDIAWSFVRDNTTNPTFFGKMTVHTSSGSAGFQTVWSPGSIDGIDLTTACLQGAASSGGCNPGTLDALVAASGTVTVGISSGEIFTPSPVSLPAALPLFASGLVGLGLLGWRKRRKDIAA